MKVQGFVPRGDYKGALQDIMWNAGSPKYFENAIATDRPLVAFVDGAKSGRGFDKFELTTALDHPTVRINGYPISEFGPEPLAFAIQSAAEYQTLERTLAQHATTNTGQTVDVAQVRLHLKPIDGYDAVSKTLFENRCTTSVHSISARCRPPARNGSLLARRCPQGLVCSPICLRQLRIQRCNRARHAGLRVRQQQPKLYPTV